jgi:hypothetical protein
MTCKYTGLFEGLCLLNYHVDSLAVSEKRLDVTLPWLVRASRDSFQL